MNVSISRIRAKPYKQISIQQKVIQAIFLTFMLGNTASQRGRILLSAVFVFFIFWKLHVLSLVFGGL